MEDDVLNKCIVDSLFENSSEMVALKNCDHVYLRVNEFCRAFIYRSKDVVGNNDYDFFNKETADLIVKIDDMVISSRLPINKDIKLRIKDDDYWLNVNKIPIIKDDQVINILDIWSCINERKNSEIEKNHSEEKFRNLVETIDDWIWETDENLCYTYVSPKVKDILGYESEELITKTPFDLMEPEEAERIKNVASDIVMNKKSFKRLENYNIHKDGRHVCLETSGVPIFDDAGYFKGYRGVDRDITERKEYERNRLVHDLAIEAVSEAIAVCDLDFSVEFANTSLINLFGCQDQQITNGMNLENILNNEEIDIEKIKYHLTSNDKWSEELLINKMDDGTFYADVNFSVVRDFESKPLKYLLIVRDISEKKLKQQKKLEYLRDQRDKIIREVHHRIKNNLQGVTGLLRNYVYKYKESGFSQELEGIINKVIDKIHSIAIVYGLQSKDANYFETKGGVDLMGLLKAISQTCETAQLEHVCECSMPNNKFVINSEEAVGMALIINEMLANACKFGLENDVCVECNCCEDSVEIFVKNKLEEQVVNTSNIERLCDEALSLIYALLPTEHAKFNLELEDQYMIAKLSIELPVFEIVEIKNAI